MPVLTDLIDALRSGRVQVVDLTAPLHSGTPILQLPPPFANASPFGLTEISRYDERGPAWYWNDIHTSEHTGTHFDAPVHWVTGQDGDDMARVPAARLVAPAAVLDFSAGEGPGLPARGRSRPGLGGRARAAARRRLAALPHRLGRPQRGLVGVPERERDRPAHARDLRGMRPLAGAGGPGARGRGGDRRHRRRGRALVRPTVPVPLLPARGGQVRADPAAEPGPVADAPARW